MKSVFQQYYDLEKNFVIDCFWDSGFRIRFGDLTNGFIKKSFSCATWEDVEKVFEEELNK